MKRIKKIIMFLLIIPALFSLSSCLYEKPKTFKNEGVTITLDNTFFRFKEREKDTCFLFYSSSKTVNIAFYDIPTASLKNMFDSIKSQVELKPVGEDTSITIKSNDKFAYQYYEFCYTEDKNEVYTLITGFSNSIYCEVAMLYTKENKKLYTETIFDWLSSIKFDF